MFLLLAGLARKIALFLGVGGVVAGEDVESESVHRFMAMCADKK